MCLSSVNSVKDICSLSKFIQVTATLGKKETEIMRRMKNDHEFLQKYMSTICLRRTKEMGFVNLQLPPKEEELIRIEFSEAERPMYEKLLCVLPHRTLPWYLKAKKLTYTQ